MVWLVAAGAAGFAGWRTGRASRRRDATDEGIDTSVGQVLLALGRFLGVLLLVALPSAILGCGDQELAELSALLQRGINGRSRFRTRCWAY